MLSSMKRTTADTRRALSQLTKATLYARYSPRRDAHLSSSNEVQAEACREYCEVKGYEVISEALDTAISGDVENRPILWEAVTSLKKGSVLVVFKPDRLARDVYLLESIRREVERRGASVEFVEGDSNGSTPQDVLIRTILAAFSAFERHVIAARTKYAMLAHQKNGRMVSKHPPYGRQRGPDDIILRENGEEVRRKTLIEHPGEMEIVAQVLVDIAGGKTYRQIAREMNKRCDPHCRGREWHHKMISNVHRRYGE